MPIYTDVAPFIKEMKGLHLYHFSLSNCAQRVRIFLSEKNLSWESHHLDILKKKENLEEEYLAINPKGLVPALVHDGKVVTESADILLYLEDMFPEPSLIPSDPGLKAEMEEWVKLASSTHLSTIKTFVYGTMGSITKQGVDMDAYANVQMDEELIAFHNKALDGFSKEEVEAAHNRILELFNRIESRLGDQQWLLGDEFTLADIAWVVQNFLYLNMMEGNLDDFPRFSAWAKRFTRRPSFKEGILDWMPGTLPDGRPNPLAA